MKIPLWCPYWINPQVLLILTIMCNHVFKSLCYDLNTIGENVLKYHVSSTDGKISVRIWICYPYVQMLKF